MSCRISLVDDIFHLAKGGSGGSIRIKGLIESIRTGGDIMKHHVGIRALAGFLCLLGMGFLLPGCSLDPNSVKLHTKEEIMKLVEERYGDAEFVSMEEVESPKHKIIFTFRDTKYGFTYQVTSRPNSVGMDGSTFWYDGAAVGDEYRDAFLQYFMEQEQENFKEHGIVLCDKVKVERVFDDNRRFSLKDKRLLSTTYRWKEDLKFVWERVHAYKKIPGLTENYEIDVYDAELVEFYGTQKEEGFVTAEEQQIEYYMNQARELAGVQDITYLRREKKKVSEVPGLSEQNFYEPELKEQDRKVMVYYFSYEGKEYFITDNWVAQYGNPDGSGGIFQFYQNYKYYKPVED